MENMKSQQSNNNLLPKGCWVWDNEARQSLPKWLYVWLGALVTTRISSSFFLKGSVPARLVLGGFVLSHVLVFGLGWADVFTIRRGHVGFFHLICWSPGWIATILEALATSNDPIVYIIWSRCIIVILGVSFLFDSRDFVTLVSYTCSGRINAVESKHN